MQNYDYIVEIEKFNPYHDSRGRFSTADAATSFTYAPGKSKAHDNAIAREKERHKESEEKSKAAIAAQKEAVTTAKTKKGEFDIFVFKDGKKGRETVSGRIDAENNIGYHKDGKSRYAQWKSTDLATGLSFGQFSGTLKGIQQATADKWEVFANLKNSNKYAGIVDSFKNAPHR